MEINPTELEKQRVNTIHMNDMDESKQSFYKTPQTGRETCFELPDDSLIEIEDKYSYLWGEMLINPLLLQEKPSFFHLELLDTIDSFQNNADLFLTHSFPVKTLHEHLIESLNLCDSNFRNNLAQNILLTGGASATSGLVQKFHNVHSLFIQSLEFIICFYLFVCSEWLLEQHQYFTTFFILLYNFSQDIN